MRVLFRLDSTPSIGTGHAIRCLTLAAALMRAGADIRVALSEQSSIPPNLALSIKAGLVPFSTPLSELTYDRGWESHPASDGVQRRDADNIKSRLTGFDPDIIVVDHYLLSEPWESCWQSARIVVIDDLANRPHRCEILLDQTYGRVADDYRALVPERCRLLLGSHFALLRNEFADLRPFAIAKRAETHSIESILVNFGGSDAGGATPEVLKALSASAFEGRIEVAIGSNAPTLEHVRTIAQGDPRITVHVDSPEMARLMLQADLAIGGGGATSWERCTLALPTLLKPVADNQTQLASNLQAAGATEIISIEDMEASLRHILRLEDGAWGRMASVAAALCDGRGTDRLVAALLGTDTAQPVVREVETRDSINLWAWRNDPETRASAKTPGIVNWTDHAEWFSRMVGSADCLLYIGEIVDQPVGMVRFDLNGKDAVVSINVAPAWRSQSVGSELLRQAVDRALQTHRIERIIAEVKAANTTSQRLFARQGFRLISENEDFLQFELAI